MYTEIQKEYQELKSMKQQLTDSMVEMKEVGDMLVQDLELGIGDTEEKAKTLLEVSMWLLKSKLAMSKLEELIASNKERLTAELN